MGDVLDDKWAIWRHAPAEPNISGVVQFGRVFTKEDCAAALAELPPLTADSTDAMKKLYWGLHTFAGRLVPKRLQRFAKLKKWRRRMDSVYYVGAAVSSMAMVSAMDAAYLELYGEEMVVALEKIHTAKLAAEVTHPDSASTLIRVVDAGSPRTASVSAAAGGAAAARAAGPFRGGVRLSDTRRGSPAAARGSPVATRGGIFRAEGGGASARAPAAAVSAEEDDVRASGSKRRLTYELFSAGLKAAPSERAVSQAVVNLQDEESVDDAASDDSAGDAVPSPTKQRGWN